MSHLSPSGRRLLSGLLVLLGIGLAEAVGAGSARAQVGSALVAVPWQPGQRASVNNYFFGLDSQSEGTTLDTDLRRAVSFGRLRFDVENETPLAVGWLYDHLDLDTADAALPPRLVSAAGAVGFNLGDIVPDWRINASVGAGVSGSQPFADEDAWYGLASLVASKRLDQTSALTLVLDYDGSRAIFPDIPLPGFQYTYFGSPTLRYSLGLPFSTLFWKPDDRWTVDLQYAVPLGGRATVSYQLDERWAAYAGYSSTTRGYHLEGDDEHRRLFFSQERAELGLTLDAAAGWKWTFAGGWAFGQEFTRGFDVRDDELVRELDDAPYLRLALDVSF